MSRRLRFPLLLFIPLIVLSAVSVQASQEAQLIELRDGTVFENCEFTISRQYKLLEVDCDEAAGKVRYAEVNRILDEDGEDITEEILGDYYRPPVEVKDGEATSEEPSGWISKGDSGKVDSAPLQDSEWETEAERSRRPNRKPYSLALVGHGILEVPFGNWYEGIGSAPGFGADLSIAVNHKYGIRISYSTTSAPTDPSFAGVIIENDLKLNRTSFLIAAEYYNWPEWRAGEGMSYHFWSGIGFVSESFSGEAIVRDYGSEEYYQLTGQDNESHVMFGLYGSAMATLAQSIGFEVAFGMDFIPVSSDDYGNAQYAYSFDVSLGLVVLIRDEQQTRRGDETQ